MRNINTRHSSNLRYSLANLVIYQNEVHTSGMKSFNSFPFNIKKLSDNPRTFTITLKCLYINPFYSLDEWHNNNSSK